MRINPFRTGQRVHDVRIFFSENNLVFLADVSYRRFQRANSRTFEIEFSDFPTCVPRFGVNDTIRTNAQTANESLHMQLQDQMTGTISLQKPPLNLVGEACGRYCSRYRKVAPSYYCENFFNDCFPFSRLGDIALMPTHVTHDHIESCSWQSRHSETQLE